MQDLSLDAICAYLHTRNPLLLMCMDNPSDPTKFDVIGFSFPSIWCGGFQSDAVPDPDRSMLMGYVMFRPYYGTPEANVCMTLTGLYFFHKFKLVSISGQSYTFNHLTRKFLAQFGAKDVGVLPRFLNLNGKLVDCHLTCLLREDFERHLAASLTIPVPSQ
jgi:RimJ/RimL family protein N-acetyltransferase